MNLFYELDKLVFGKYAHIIQAGTASGREIVRLFDCVDSECLIDLGFHPTDKNDDDEWKEIFNLCVRVTSTRTYLDMVSVPPEFQRQGVASDIIRCLSEWVKFRHRTIGTDLVLYLSDISPDYNDRQGITTYLVNKYGLQAIDENTEY